MTFKIHAESVVMRSLDSLEAYDKNARTHPPEQIEVLVRLIQDSGFTNPLLIESSGRIIAGHGRFLAATELGMEAVPCVVVDGLSEEKIKALRISDNQLALRSGWDADLLRLEVLDLGDDFDLDLLGFGENLQNVLLERLDGENDPAAHWDGMPSFENQDKTAFRILPVHFKDQEAVDAFAKLVGQKITDKTRSLWFPEIEIETYADKRYVAE